MYCADPFTGLTRLPVLPARKGAREYLFNMGGPMSRTRTEKLSSSLLGSTDGPISCPMVARLGLNFGKLKPVELLRELLQEEGYQSPEELKDIFLPYKRTYICHVSAKPKPVVVKNATPEIIFYQAVMLGLCTTTIFDPARPVIWTNASLTRCLDLYDMKGFYA